MLNTRLKAKSLNFIYIYIYIIKMNKLYTSINVVHQHKIVILLVSHSTKNKIYYYFFNIKMIIFTSLKMNDLLC